MDNLPGSVERITCCNPENGYTGQRSEMDSLGLYFYNARWMDPQLGRFIQADSIVPGGAQGLDRYAYVSNNPLKYIDPTGHYEQCDSNDRNCDGKDDDTRYLPPLHPGTDKYKGTNRCLSDPDCQHRNGYTGSHFVGSQPPSYVPGGAGNDGSMPQFGYLAQFAKYGKAVIDVAIWIGDYGKPAYKQLKSLGNAGPVVEGSAGATLQYLQDIDNDSLSPGTKIIRAGIVGVEDAVSDIVSGPFAAAGAATAAGVGLETGPGALVLGAAGYVAGSYLATQAMDNLVWAPVNSWSGYFP